MRHHSYKHPGTMSNAYAQPLSQLLLQDACLVICNHAPTEKDKERWSQEIQLTPSCFQRPLIPRQK